MGRGRRLQIDGGFSVRYSVRRGSGTLKRRERQVFVGNIRQDQFHIIPPLHGPSPPFLPSFFPSSLPLTCHNYRVNVRKDFTDFSPPPSCLTRLDRPGKQLQLTQATESVIIEVVDRPIAFVGLRRNNCRWMDAFILPLPSLLPLPSRSLEEPQPFFSCRDVSNHFVGILHRLKGTVPAATWSKMSPCHLSGLLN